jgi:predicted RND superfamily exporter protein
MVMRFIRLLLRHRAWSIAVLALSLVAAAFGISKIRVQFSYRDYYDYPANKDLPTFIRYTEQFGDPGGCVVLLLQTDDVFRPATLSYVAAISSDLAAGGPFSRVRSLSTVRLVRAVGDSVEAGVLMSRVPDTPEGLANLRDTILRSKLLSRRLVSDDGTTTAVLADMRTPASVATIAEESEAIDAVRKAIERRPPPPGLTATITGGPSVEAGVARSIVHDLFVMTPASLVVILIALVVTFRSAHGVLLAMVTLTVSVLWTAGLFGLIGRPIDLLGTVSPAAILVYGAVDPIFVLTRYFNKLEITASRERALLEALSELLLPCFLTSLTTALGFAAFATATMPTVRYLGLVVAMGVALSFVTTVTVLPLLLSIVPPPRRALSTFGLQRAVVGGLERAWRAANAHRGVVVASAVAVLALTVVTTRQLRVGNSYVETLPDGPDRRAVRLIEQKLSGITRFVVYLEGPPGSMVRPEVLRAIAAVEARAEQEPQVNSTASLPDLLATANQAFAGGDASDWRLPDSGSLIAQYLSLLDPRDRGDFVDQDDSQTAIAILATDDGGVAAKHLREVLEGAVDKQHFQDYGVRVSLTGNGVMTYRELDKIVVQIVYGFGVAFAIVLALEFLIFRSIRIALISIVPNLLPVCTCFVAMHLLRMDLRLDNALVLCLSIGALFNTTIHIVARIRQEIAAGATDTDAIVERALKAVGPASFYTAAVLSCGFAVLLLSNFPGFKQLGLFALVTMLTAFFSDVVFTTTFMALFYDWDGAFARARRSPRRPLGAAHNDDDLVRYPVAETRRS